MDSIPWGRCLKTNSEEFGAQPEYIWLVKDERVGVKSQKAREDCQLKAQCGDKEERHPLQLIESRSSTREQWYLQQGPADRTNNQRWNCRKENKPSQIHTQTQMSWFDLVLCWHSVNVQEVVYILSVLRFRDYQNHHEMDREWFTKKINIVYRVGWWLYRSLLQSLKNQFSMSKLHLFLLVKWSEFEHIPRAQHIHQCRWKSWIHTVQ